MVPADRLHEFERETPEAHEDAAEFGVGGAEGLLFRDADGDAFGTGDVEDLEVFLGKVAGEHEFADVVEEAGGEGGAGGFGVADLPLGDGLRVGADLHRVVPELVKPECGDDLGIELGEDACDEDEALDAVRAEEHDRVGRADDRLMQTEEGRIHQLEHLGRHDGILGDDLRHLGQAGLGRVQFVHDPRVDRGKGGQLLHLPNESLEFLGVHPRAHQDAPVEDVFPRVRFGIEGDVVGERIFAERLQVGSFCGTNEAECSGPEYHDLLEELDLRAGLRTDRDDDAVTALRVGKTADVVAR